MTDAPPSLRLFGSPAFFRLWLAQFVSSLGDWIGFIAITAIAARVGGGSPEAAVGIVLSARLVPGFFLGTVAGVLVDRWNRKTVMVICDIGRGLVLATLPFVDTLPGLFVASLCLELLTLLWSPAKEATVPNMVRPDFLATANSLSLVAAYGTFPIGSLVFALLAKVALRLAEFDALAGLRVSQETVAIWFDVGTYLLSAAIISTLALPRRARTGDLPLPKAELKRGLGLSRTFRELAEGWRYIGSSPLVRSVIVGLCTGLIGAGMIIPLAPVFTKEVVHGGSAGFGVLLTGLGTGMALGIIGLSLVQSRLPHHRAFVAAVMGSGVAMVAAASMSAIVPAVVLVSILGLCGGAVYVLGFTILGTEVDDELRGRIFATLYTMVRFCLLLAMAVGPFLAGLLNQLSNRLFDGHIEIGAWSIAVPGVRITLWLGGVILLVAGVLAGLAMRSRAPDPLTDGVAGDEPEGAAGSEPVSEGS